MEFLGWIATVCFGICYYPQIYRSYKRKLVGDISVWPWILQTIGYLTGIGYGIYLRQWPLFIGYTHGLFCSIVFLILYWRYKNNV